MFWLLGLMFLGFFIGYLIRKQSFLVNIFNVLLMFSIYFLLFFIGIEVGSNDLIFSKLAEIGLNSFLLSLSAVIGTLIVAWFFYLKFFKKE